MQRAAAVGMDFNQRQHKSISDEALVQLVGTTGSEIPLQCLRGVKPPFWHGALPSGPSSSARGVSS